MSIGIFSRTVKASGAAVLALAFLAGCSQEAASDQEFTSMQMQGVELAPVEVDIDGAAQRLAKGVTFRTISNQDRDDFDTEAFSGYHAYLAETYPNVTRTLKREVLGDPRPYSLLYTWEGTDPEAEPVLFYAHMDVVPVPEESRDQWDQDPFAGVIADGYIWGRGVLDDKNQVQAILEAAEMKIKEGWQPTRTMYFVFGQDEEVGGPEGARFVAETLEQRGIERFHYVMDESAPIMPGVFPGVDDNTALITIAQKGFVSLELAINGVGGHSMQPPLEPNIVILAEAITKLNAAQFPYRIHPAIRQVFRYLGPEMDEAKQPMYAAVAFGKDGEITELEQQFIDEMATTDVTRAMLHTTIAPTIFNAGIKDNVLPPSATAVVNFRPMPGDTPEVIIEHVKNAIGDDRIEVRDISASTPATAVANTDSDAYRVLDRTIRQIWGNDLIVAPLLSIGGSDTKHFQARPFAPDTFAITALQLESQQEFAGFHGVNERILVDEYAKSIGFFYRIFENLNEM